MTRHKAQFTQADLRDDSLTCYRIDGPWTGRQGFLPLTSAYRFARWILGTMGPSELVYVDLLREDGSIVKTLRQRPGITQEGAPA